MLKYMNSNDDIFESSCQTITNPVNCVGVMGGGLAREFKLRYPEMYEEYVRKCDAKELKPGVLHLWKGADKWVLNFPTKDHWIYDSDIQYIAGGLDTLVHNYKAWGITSIAFPALGCGYGGLDWKDVKILMDNFLSIAPFYVEIYPPRG